MLAAMGLMVSLFAVAAYAAEIQGTGNSEVLVESTSVIDPTNGLNDKIAGHRGEDEIHADENGFDTDKVKGQRQRDTIHVDDGDTDDIANGGPGMDTCYIDDTSMERDTTVSCEFINPPVAP
jgi:hypothetical protein